MVDRQPAKDIDRHMEEVSEMVLCAPLDICSFLLSWFASE